MTEPAPPLPPADPRERLLLAAEEVFARKGFDGATTREICERAGMNGAAINYHFRDKEGLYVAAVRGAHSCTHAASAPPAEPLADPVAELTHTIRTMLSHMHGPVRASALQLVMREIGQPTPATVSVVEEYIRPMADRLGHALHRLAPDLGDPERLMVAFSIVGQCLYYRQNRNVSVILFGAEAIDALGLERVTAHITRFTLAALGFAEPLLRPYSPESP